jgi:signal transduction histidine kinase
MAEMPEEITDAAQGEAEANSDQLRLSMALEAAEMVTWEWDIPTRSIRYSDNIRTIARGATVEPYCSLDGLMLKIHPEDRERVVQALDQTTKEGIPFECEYRVRMVDGAYRWILGKGKRVILEGGKPVRVLGISMDITDRRKIEEELRRSRDDSEIRVRERTEELARANRELKAELEMRQQTEQALRKLTQNLDERIREANCQYSVSYHVGRHHLSLDERLREIVNCIPSGWQYPEITCARIVLQGKEYKTDNFKETPWRQASEILLDGERIGVAEVFLLEERPEKIEGAFLRDERNLINSIAIELGEMSAYFRADVAMKVERQRLKEVLEVLPVYVVLLTQDYHVSFANRVFRERFGESYGRRCFECLFNRSEPCEVCETYTVLRTMAPHEWEWLGPDGRSYHVFDFPFADTDGSTLILEMGIDITERKRTEEALKESEKRLRLLSSQLLVTQEKERKLVSREIHDSIGASLAATKYRVEDAILKVGDAHPKTRAALENILPVLQDTIQEARRIQMALRPAILDDLGIVTTIGWLCRQFESTYSHIRINQEIDIEESDVPDSLKIVLFRVLQEAMNNIGKHSKATRVSVSFRKLSGAIELGIQDEGQGFDPEKAGSRPGATRGLGLDSMRERTKLSGGTFSIESKEGTGTVIRATWPIEHPSL